MNNKNILKINDSTYDATTGVLIDGPGEELKPSEVIKKARQAAAHARAHNRQKSKTLMRHAVKKPASHTSKKFNSSLPIHSNTHLNKKLSAKTVNRDRLESSRAVSRHRSIKKFAPQETNFKNTVETKELHQTSTKINQKKAPSTDDLLMHAIHQSTSHEEKYIEQKQLPFSFLQKKSSQAAIIMALLVIVVLGFMPAAQLKIASNKAGFSIKKPEYQTSGFSLKEVISSPGEAEIRYSSNSDNRSYAVKEKISKLDNNNLSGVLAMTSNSQQFITSKGKNIFIDSNGRATWANGEVEYTIETFGNLSNRQIAEIADSL